LIGYFHFDPFGCEQPGPEYAPQVARP
jgi:hypothetical protein